MGSGPLARRKPAPDAHGAKLSGQAGSKPNGPEYSRTRVVVGLPLRTKQTSPLAVATKTGTMAGKDDVFQKTSNIFVVLGASVSEN